MDNLLGIENTKIKLGNNIHGACYCYDLYGNLIGWYDFDTELLHVHTGYTYMDSLHGQLLEHDVDYTFDNEIEEVVLEYYKQFHEERMKMIADHKERMRKFDENMKLLPYKYKRVKDAENKIKERHD